MRITRAKPEQAGSGSVGETKQASMMRLQQWWAEELAVGIFIQLLQLNWPELSQMQCCHLLHRAVSRKSLSATIQLGDFFPRKAYMYFIGTSISERVSGRGADYPMLWLPNPLGLDP